MRGDVQVRFGGRTRETHQLKGWQGALARPYAWAKPEDRRKATKLANIFRD